MGTMEKARVGRGSRFERWILPEFTPVEQALMHRPLAEVLAFEARMAVSEQYTTMRPQAA